MYYIGIYQILDGWGCARVTVKMHTGRNMGGLRNEQRVHLCTGLSVALRGIKNETWTFTRKTRRVDSGRMSGDKIWMDHVQGISEGKQYYE